MESKATVKYLKSSAQKARLVADVIRGKMVGDALNILEFGVKKKVARDMAKVLKSAVANMQSKNMEAAIDAEELRIKSVCVDSGPTMKRFRARAQGRAAGILKRTCHISVTLTN